MHVELNVAQPPPLWQQPDTQNREAELQFWWAIDIVIGKVGLYVIYKNLTPFNIS